MWICQLCLIIFIFFVLFKVILFELLDVIDRYLSSLPQVIMIHEQEDVNLLLFVFNLFAIAGVAQSVGLTAGVARLELHPVKVSHCFVLVHILQVFESLTLVFNASLAKTCFIKILIF